MEQERNLSLERLIKQQEAEHQKKQSHILEEKQRILVKIKRDVHNSHKTQM
jgi:hypothetical protein